MPLPSPSDPRRGRLAIPAVVAALALVATAPAAGGVPASAGEGVHTRHHEPSVAPSRAWADSLKDISHVRYLLYRDYCVHPTSDILMAGGASDSVAGFGASRPQDDLSIAPPCLTDKALGVTDRWECDADQGEVCDGGDADKGLCDVNQYCHMDPRHFLEVVTKAAVRYPASGYLTGQAIYALVKYKLPIRAMQLVQRCRASPWWCDALHGYALQKMGAPEDASRFLRKAMEEAPDSISCGYTDATWLLSDWDTRQDPFTPPGSREHAAAWDCARREAVSDTIWWLSDPLYSVPGNERWGENVVRFLTARFQREIDEEKPFLYSRTIRRPVRWAETVRRGTWNSYAPPRGEYTSKGAARYHFVPAVGVEDLSSPEWHLEAHLNQEGYTPPGRPFSEIPAQVARFRHGDSLRIAVATTLRDAPVEPDPDSASWLIFTDGPRSFPLKLEGRVHGDRSVFVGEVAPRRYVTSLEVRGDSTIGWHRQTVDPLETGGPGLSDLLLYRPTGPADPDSLLLAAGLMLGSTTVDKEDDLGVYWETYGLPADSAKAHVSFSVTLVPAGGGVGALLGRLIPGGGQEWGRVAWTEPGEAGTHRRAIDLDLTDVDPGAYTLVLRAAWPGQPPLERRLDVTVE